MTLLKIGRHFLRVGWHSPKAHFIACARTSKQRDGRVFLPFVHTIQFVPWQLPHSQGRMAVSLCKPRLYFSYLPVAICSRHAFPKRKVLIQVSLTAPVRTFTPLLFARSPKWEQQFEWVRRSLLLTLTWERLRIIYISINIGSNLSRELWFDLPIFSKGTAVQQNQPNST